MRNKKFYCELDKHVIALKALLNDYEVSRSIANGEYHMITESIYWKCKKIIKMWERRDE